MSEEDVTEDQRARISSKFRAAKALLARKRPSLSLSPSPSPPLRRRSDIAHSPSLLSCVPRDPVSELSTNTRAFRQEAISNSSTVLTGLREASFGGAPAEQTRIFLASDSLFPSDTVIPDNELDSALLDEVDVLCQLKYLDQTDGDDRDPSVKDDEESPERRFCSSDIPPEGVTEDRVKSDYDMGLASRFLGIIASPTIIDGNMPEAYARYLDKLNAKQLEAACSDISIPLMIVAGPGSGKTSTMVGRILVLLGKGIRASNILAMTFTTAAAAEMKGRISTVAGKEVAEELSVSTFHSFALQLCRSHAKKLERTSEFLIYGHGQQRRAVIEAMRLSEKENSKQIYEHLKLENLNDLHLPHLKDKSKKWQNFVTQAKASGKTPQDFSKVGDYTRATILKNYGDILKFCDALDYHDLISCSVNLLSNFPQVRKESQDVWKAIIIDEFQDTSSMQYRLLRSLASHNCITIIGDEDQSIFGFSGANISGFNSFRKDFPNHKEVRLVKNYRSTRCIVEAASSLIQKNTRRCQFKNVLTDNASGSKITIKECRNEDAQCAFVIDKILEATSNNSDAKSSFGDIAILYRRQVSGKVFQSAFRDRNIPFNVHGVAFYRKKVVRSIISMLKTTLPGCDDGPYRQVFKVLLPMEKEEKEKVIGHVDKVSAIRRCSFLSAASDIFVAKLSGTLKRNHLTLGRKVLSTLEMISKLVSREQSLSTVIISVANMVPQKYLLEQKAVVDFDGGRLLNEDSDLRTVLHYLLDDVSNFLSTQFVATECCDNTEGQEGCRNILKAFIDFLSAREAENFRSRRDDNRNSVALTTIHQSKGLEWDIVFIIKVNESEIPLLHEHNGAAEEIATLLEEERRLLYVAMTRARKKLFILYVSLDSSWQMVQPSRFLNEIPGHLLDFLVSNKDILLSQVESPANNLKANHNLQLDIDQTERKYSEAEILHGEVHGHPSDIGLNRTIDMINTFDGNSFLKRFRVDERSVVSHLFHQWAKKPAFKDPKRLLGKVGFVIDERLRVNKNKHKDVLSELKNCLTSDDALHYAQYVLRWEQMPPDQRECLMKEKQEHFQKLRIEKSMGSVAPTLKQVSYLQNLGCTVAPSSRLHAFKLIEHYKSL